VYQSNQTIELLNTRHFQRFAFLRETKHFISIKNPYTKKQKVSHAKTQNAEPNQSGFVSHQLNWFTQKRKKNSTLDLPSKLFAIGQLALTHRHNYF
jgi:hypothetical protein